MNQAWSLFSAVEFSQLASILMMTLAHFLWQGTVVGLLVFIALRNLKNNSANVRYFVAFVGFSCLPIVCFATFILKANSEYSSSTPRIETSSNLLALNSLNASSTTIDPEHSASHHSKMNSDQVQGTNSIQKLDNGKTLLNRGVSPDANSNIVQPASQNRGERPSSSSRIQASSANKYNGLLFENVFVALCVTTIYLIGAATMLVRLMILVGFGRARRIGELKPDANLDGFVQRLSPQVGIRNIPRVSLSETVLVPAVVGIIKPIILVPTSAATGLSRPELESILLHELAHIRRFDVIANLFQKLVEAVLFFHPTVWWLSQQVNTERENCCDDIAAKTGSGRLGYAEALLRMAEICSFNLNKHKLDIGSVSANGKRPSQLVRRIQRMMSISDAPPVKPSGLIALILLSLIVFSTFFSTLIGQERKAKNAESNGANSNVARTAEKTDSSASISVLNASEKSNSTHPQSKAQTEDLTQDVTEIDEKADVDKRAITIVESKMEYKFGEGSWQSGAHESTVQWNLTMLEPREKVITALLDAIQKPGAISTGGRRHALRFLAGRAPTQLVPVLKKQLEAHSKLPKFKNLPLNEIDSLRRIGAAARDAVSLLVKLLGQDRSVTFKGAIIDALVEIDPISRLVIDAIASQLEHPNKYFRANVVYQLGRFEKDAARFKDRLIELLDDEYQDVRIWAAQALIKTEAKPQKGFGFLYERLENGNREEKKLAATALAALGTRGDEALSRLNQQRSIEKDSGVLKQINEAISRIQKDDRILSHKAKFQKISGDRQASSRTLAKLRTESDKVSGKKIDDSIQHMPTKDSDGEILWGDAIKGIQLGIRQADHEKSMTFRHGDLLAYEFWIRNDSTKIVHFLNHTWKVPRPALWRGKQINPIATSLFLRLGGLDTNVVTINPGQKANFLTWATIAFIRPADPKKKYAGSTLRLKPDQYLVKAERSFSYYIGGDADLKRKDSNSIRLVSGSESIQIKPAGRIQIRKWTKSDPDERHKLDSHWKTLLDEDGIASAKATHDIKTDSWLVEIKLNELGKKVYGWEANRLQKVGIHKQAMSIDGKVVSEPFPFPENLDSFTITLSLAKSKAMELVNTINSLTSDQNPKLESGLPETASTQKQIVPKLEKSIPKLKDNPPAETETQDKAKRDTKSKGTTEITGQSNSQEINKVQWGERKNGLRMGIRRASKGKPGHRRPGDRVFY